MRPLPLLLTLSLMLPGTAATADAPLIPVPAGSDLQAVMDAAPDGAILQLEAGSYRAAPQRYTDPLCGNCQEHATAVDASTGFVLRGKSLTLQGPSEGTATLQTKAGYGFFIEDAPQVTLERLTISEGVRDRDGRATDGAVVVRNSRVVIRHCTLGPNPVPAKLLRETIVGICGLVGREGAELFVSHTRIHGNTWDGIALYRGAMLEATDVQISDGRGVGIGITWDSQATVTRAEVSGYWKGIGSFGTSTATLTNCLVHTLRGWGLVATGSSQMSATNCSIVRCGNVGVALWNPEASLELVNSIVWGNGTEKEWVAPRVGLWWNSEAEPMVRYCLFGNNAEGDFQRGYGDTADRTWSLAGIAGNRLGHPLYRQKDRYVAVLPSSPIFDVGDPLILDRDGSRSDLGITGGPAAW